MRSGSDKGLADPSHGTQSARKTCRAGGPVSVVVPSNAGCTSTLGGSGSLHPVATTTDHTTSAEILPAALKMLRERAVRREVRKARQPYRSATGATNERAHEGIRSI